MEQSLRNVRIISPSSSEDALVKVLNQDAHNGHKSYAVDLRNVIFPTGDAAQSGKAEKGKKTVHSDGPSIFR